MNHEYWLRRAAEVASRATCRRKRCGAVVIVNEVVGGVGWNGPPPGVAHRCLVAKASKAHPRSDRTCCVHAEQRALIEYARGNWQGRRPRLYFARLDDAGTIAPSGHPYCTMCSRMALDVGIHEWIMLTGDGVQVWPAAVFDELSHQEPPNP